MYNIIKLIFDIMAKIVDNSTMAKILRVAPHSALSGLIEAGEEVLSFNGRTFVDILDYIYADSLNSCVLEVKGQDGIRRVNADLTELSLGLDFDDSVEITAKECVNNCIFCFVKQLPANLRQSLYVRDDDYRLSFISGCYITCTNLREEDIQRIIDYKLSPLYVSVHATDPDVRNKLLGIKRSADQAAVMERLINNGIVIHAQIVLVPNINDGAVLEKSLNDLIKLGVKTVAVVPVGLTGHRQALPKIAPVSKEQGRNAIDIVERIYRNNPGFCYCSDEMYLIAGREIPDGEFYGEYEQIENGVGLVTKFMSELNAALQECRSRPRRQRTVGLFTGMSGKGVMERAKTLIEGQYKKVKVNVYPVVNTFFGPSVTVTGLVTATDIIAAFGNTCFREKYLIIPQVMLKEFETVFLDNVRLESLSKSLKKKIIVSPVTGEGLLNAVLYGKRRI